MMLEHERTRLIHSTLGTFIYLHPDGKGQLLYEKEVKPGGVVERAPESRQHVAIGIAAAASPQART